jgi:DNA mismatch repair protein MutS
MPRSAAQPPEQALQGNLFGAPEPAADPSPPRTRSDQVAAATADLSDASLSADAHQRPRQRRKQESEAAPASDHSNEAGDETPARAHHSQMDPLQLTPMLRHYAGTPEKGRSTAAQLVSAIQIR